MRVVLVFVLLFVVLSLAAVQIPSRGWGDNIEWYSYKEGLNVAEETGKKIMIVFHSTSCGACKRIKPLFAESEEIAELSKHYVMINVQNQEEPSSSDVFLKDGGYIPRIYFADSAGVPDYSVGSGNERFNYYYPGVDAIAEQMKAFAEK